MNSFVNVTSNKGTASYAKPFSHIYIEEAAFTYPTTKRILKTFPNAVCIKIKHYKDVFNRTHQNFTLQKRSPALILAVKQDHLVYEGANVCQNFGNQHFYYTSSVMNCIYDCEYCYLQGMYPSANLVLFVNLEDIFSEVEQLLSKHPVYLCISYDTDLLAIEHWCGFVERWHSFCMSHEGLTIELRTKSANREAIMALTPLDRFIFAWTLSPEPVIHSFEHKTPSLFARLSVIKEAVSKGLKVRLSFDPVLRLPDWEKLYQEMIQTVFTSITPDSITDISLGVFRISSEYMKQMRKQRPDSPIIQYPYQNDHGVFHVGLKKGTEMIDYVINCLSKYDIREDKLFIWVDNSKETDGGNS